MLHCWVLKKTARDKDKMKTRWQEKKNQTCSPRKTPLIPFSVSTSLSRPALKAGRCAELSFKSMKKISFCSINCSHNHQVVVGSRGLTISKILDLYLSSFNWFIGLVGRVFASGPGDLGSITGRVIPKTLKMVLDTSCLTLSNIRYISRVKWSNPGKGVAPSPSSQCSSYWKGSLLVVLYFLLTCPMLVTDWLTLKNPSSHLFLTLDSLFLVI